MLILNHASEELSYSTSQYQIRPVYVRVLRQGRQGDAEITIAANHTSETNILVWSSRCGSTTRSTRDIFISSSISITTGLAASHRTQFELLDYRPRANDGVRSHNKDNGSWHPTNRRPHPSRTISYGAIQFPELPLPRLVHGWSHLWTR